FPLNERTISEARPALAICDWGLQSAVKTAVACDRAGVDHLPGLRLRVVHEAAWHPLGRAATRAATDRRRRRGLAVSRGPFEPGPPFQRGLPRPSRRLARPRTALPRGTHLFDRCANGRRAFTAGR